MSRHRAVRTMNYNDEYDGYDDVYGHSVDDDSCISPTDASQWIYDRERSAQSMSGFLATHRDIQEENEDNDDDIGLATKQRRDSEHFQMPNLNEEDSVKLASCIDAIRDVVGESVSERQLVETIMKFNFDCAKSLDTILDSNAASSSTPPKAKRGMDLQNVAVEKDCISKLSSSEEKKFTNLSDLAKFHLTSATSSPQTSDNKIVLPKLFSSASKPITLPKLSFSKRDNSSSISPHQSSLQKIMELKKLSLYSSAENVSPPQAILIAPKITSPIVANNWIVDLSTALKTDIPSAQMTVTTMTKESPPSETDFIPKFIECDIKPLLENQITRDCEIDCSDILHKILKTKQRSASKFGRILCRRYKVNSLPVVKHEFKAKNVLRCYNFASPSPDDIVLTAMRKAKYRL